MKAGRSAENKVFLITVIAMPCLVALGILFAAFQMSRLETGVLDVCASQQDAYVDLVLDQINLRGDLEDEEIIADILGTMDASSNKYWTFSSQETMLFVKDVLETNKYKGFTPATFYVSDSASAFFQALQLNRVTHATITIEEETYIASGVMFRYRGEEYRLCLLTNRSALLDNNSFLGARTEMWLMILAVLALLLTLPLLLARGLRNSRRERDGLERRVEQMNVTLERLSDRLAQRDFHDTRKNLWSRESLDKFLTTLAAKTTRPVTLARVHCADETARDGFLELACYELDRKVLRIQGEGADVILLFLDTPEEVAWQSVIPLMSQGVALDGLLSGRPGPELARRLTTRQCEQVQGEVQPG